MRLSLTNQGRFPKSALYIRRVLPTVIDILSIRRAMARFGELDTDAFREALRWDTDPLIVPVPGLESCASFSASNPDQIELRESIFTEFEAGRGYLRSVHGLVPALGVNILHEMCHWGDMRDGVQQTNDDGSLFEEGQAFEMAVYGRDLQC
jgi:hypothetical protein